MSTGRTPSGGRFVKYNTAALVLALALASCSTIPNPPAQVVEMTGPRIARADLDCGGQPVPPDPKAPATALGKAAARYENNLGAWGQGCKDKLTSVGKVLDAAGQVVGE